MLLLASYLGYLGRRAKFVALNVTQMCVCVYMCVCVRACVRACARVRACVRACVCVCV